MHYALKQSFPAAEVVCAFDINTVANDVYQHNHGKRPHQVSKAATHSCVSSACRSHPTILLFGQFVAADWHNTSKQTVQACNQLHTLQIYHAWCDLVPGNIPYSANSLQPHILS